MRIVSNQSFTVVAAPDRWPCVVLRRSVVGLGEFLGGTLPAVIFSRCSAIPWCSPRVLSAGDKTPPVCVQIARRASKIACASSRYLDPEVPCLSAAPPADVRACERCLLASLCQARS